MGAFRFIWHKIVSCLQGEVTTEQLRKYLRKKLQGSHALKEDLAHFDREEFKAGSEDFMYKYLLESMGRYFRRHGQDRNQHQFEKRLQTEIEALTSGKKLSAAALTKVMNATPGKGEGKGGKGGKGPGKGKGKGKGGNDQQQCYYHNAAHYDPASGKGCKAPLDPSTGKQHVGTYTPS